MKYIKVLSLILVFFLSGCRQHIERRINPRFESFIHRDIGENLQIVDVAVYNHVETPKKPEIHKRSLFYDYTIYDKCNHLNFFIQGQFSPLNKNYNFKIVKAILSNRKQSIEGRRVEKGKFQKLWYFEETPQNMEKYYNPELKDGRNGSKKVNGYSLIRQRSDDDSLGSYHFSVYFNDEIIVNEDLELQIFFTEQGSNVQSVRFTIKEIMEFEIESYYDEYLQRLSTY